MATVPTNRFADAQDIGLGSFGEYVSDPFSTVGFTTETGEPLHPGNYDIGATAWLKYRPVSSDRITVDTILSGGQDTELGIYTGYDVDALTLIAGDSDSGGSDYTSIVGFDAVGGTTYYIQVGGYEGAELNQVVVRVRHGDFVPAQPLNSLVLAGSMPPLGIGTQLTPPAETVEPEVITVTLEGLLPIGVLTVTDIPPIVTPEFRVDVLDSTIQRAPSSLTAVVQGGQSNTPIVFRIDGSVVLTVTSSSDGGLGPTSVPVTFAGSSVGSHTLSISQLISNGDTILASTTFSTAYPPHLLVATGVVVDTEPVEIDEAVTDGVRHFVLQDLMPGGLGSYVFPHSPRQSSSPYVEHALAAKHTTAKGGQFHISQARHAPRDWTLTGFCPSQAQQAALEAYRDAGRRFYAIDHRNRAWKVVVKSADFVPRLRKVVNDVMTDWGSDYTITFAVLDQEWQVPQ